MKKFLSLCVALALVGPLNSCHKAEKLHLFAWSEYIPKEVIDGFTKETGIAVDYQFYDSNEAMVA